jgi:3-phytase
MIERATGEAAQRRTLRPASPPAAIIACAAVLLSACSTGDSPGGSAAAGTSTPSIAATVPGAVSATVETEPVEHSGDAADDPAVWVNPDDPTQSAIVATDKLGGLLVYDLDGRQLQYLPSGDMNNVDVRPASGNGVGFVLGGSEINLVVAGNRTSNTIGVYALDPATRQLSDIAAGPIEPGIEVYGSCLYRSAATGAFYVFVNSKNGEVEQWVLADDRSGKVTGALVRTFGVDSQTEGCVADDELGNFYLGEEARGIWKFGAEPEDGAAGTLIAEVSPSGPLVGQVEGLTLAYGRDGAGYLFASSQGDNSYAVFRREDDNAYVGSFRLAPGEGVDASERTDGIDVTTADLGPDFPRGVFVTQDGENDDGNQNFKLVPYERILSD